MSKSSKGSPPRDGAAAGSQVRSTAEGTHRFSERHLAAFASDFFRRTALGFTVSSIGIGTYLGDSTDADDAAYESAIRAAVQGGINVIDSAINYRSQRSERAVGTAIRAIAANGIAARDELVVCTKAGYIPFDQNPPATREEYQSYVQRTFVEPRIVHPSEIVAGGHSIAPRFLRYCLAKSRQNLGLRTVDLFYLHNPEQQLSDISHAELRQRLALSFEFFEESVARDEIGAYGIATWDGLRVGSDHAGHLELESVVEVARDVGGEDHHFRAVQVPMNLAMPEAFSGSTQTSGGQATSVVQAAADMGISVFASASLLQGRLARGLPAQIVEHFPALTTDAQRSLAFVRGIQGVSSALVGMRSADHVAQNLAAGRR